MTRFGWRDLEIIREAAPSLNRAMRPRGLMDEYVRRAQPVLEDPPATPARTFDTHAAIQGNRHYKNA